METHIKHARQWGYPTHISRHDPSGNSGQIRLVLEKALHVLSMCMTYDGDMQVHLVGVDSERRKEAAVLWVAYRDWKIAAKDVRVS